MATGFDYAAFQAQIQASIEKALESQKGQPNAQEVYDHIVQKTQEMVKYMQTTFTAIAEQLKPMIEAHNRLEEAAIQYAAVTNEPPDPIVKHYQAIAEALARTSTLTYTEAMDAATEQLKGQIRYLLMGPLVSVSRQSGKESVFLDDLIQASRQMGKTDRFMADISRERSEQIVKDASKKWRDNLGKKRGKRRL